MSVCQSGSCLFVCLKLVSGLLLEMPTSCCFYLEGERTLLFFPVEFFWTELILLLDFDVSSAQWSECYSAVGLFVRVMTLFCLKNLIYSLDIL